MTQIDYLHHESIFRNFQPPSPRIVHPVFPTSYFVLFAVDVMARRNLVELRAISDLRKCHGSSSRRRISEVERRAVSARHRDDCRKLYSRNIPSRRRAQLSFDPKRSGVIRYLSFALGLIAAHSIHSLSDNAINTVAKIYQYL